MVIKCGYYNETNKQTEYKTHIKILTWDIRVKFARNKTTSYLTVFLDRESFYFWIQCRDAKKNM